MDSNQEPAMRSPGRTDEPLGIFDVLVPLARNKWALLAATVGAGLAGFAIASVLPKHYTSTTLLLIPQQQQGGAMASAMASLGSLSGLLGGGAMKSPADQYLSLLSSQAVTDPIIDAFDLRAVYDVRYREQARKKLGERTRHSLGKKDGLLTIEVEDVDPQRAAQIANRHVDELRRVANGLAMSEAQQRRAFFEQELRKTRDALTQAQTAMESSGIGTGALKSEPRAAAESYARLRAEMTSAEVRLQALRRNLSDSTPEVRQAEAAVSTLRAQVQRMERMTQAPTDESYVAKYREFKYQEMLFELFARQYESARLDEAREGALIQVVDVARPAERPSWPKRGLFAVAKAALVAALLSAVLITRHLRRRSVSRPITR